MGERMTKKQRAKIYLKAAEILFAASPPNNEQPRDARWACNAIEHAQGYTRPRFREYSKRIYSDEAIIFAQFFSPDDISEYEEHHGFFGSTDVEANQIYRLTALCFASAMVEAGDL